MNMSTFKIGDTVVEPSIGVCQVQGIRTMIVDGSNEDYYIFQGNNAKVMVPRSQLEKRGIRRPMSKEDARKVTGALKVPVNPTRGDARLQYLEYQETMRSGDPARISKLLRKLFILDQSDDLKGKEKELMEQAKKFLVDEITFTQGDSKTKVTNDVDESLRAMYKKKLQHDRETVKERLTAKIK